MMKTLGGFFAVAAAAFVSNCAGAQELTPQVLQKLKAATVYVEMSNATGTGVLFKKSGTTGWILTCAHVVQGEKFAGIVFRSGTASEKLVRAKVTGADAKWDLACCVVENEKDLPEPLSLGTKTEIQLLAPAFVAGFPFGQALGMGDKHPEISITVAKVDSILRDDLGQVGVVQLNGEVNPGNSGGPVVDSKGKVIGIAAAKLRGTQTAFAVPGESVKQFLLGSALTVSFAPGAQTATSVKCEVFVHLSDPMGVVKSAGVAFGWRRKFESSADPREGAGWCKVGTFMKDSPLKIDPAKGEARGTVEITRLPADPARDVLIYQVYWVQGDGAKIWAEPAAVEVNFQRTAADQNAPAKPPPDLSMRLPNVDIASLPRPVPAAKMELEAAMPDIVFSRDGKRLFALDLTHGTLLAIAADGLKVEASLDIGEDAVALAVSPDEKLIAVVLRRVVLPEAEGGRTLLAGTVKLIDPAKWTVAKSFEIPMDPVDAAINDFGALYVTGNPGLVLADVASGRIYEIEKTLYPSSYARFHPDQGRLYLGETLRPPYGHVCVLPPTRLDGRAPYYHGSIPDTFAQGGDFEISPDGSRLVNMYGGVLVLSRAPALDMLPDTRIVPWTSFAFSPKGDFAFAASADGTLRRYDTKTFENPRTWNLGLRASRLLMDPAGKVLYALVAPVPDRETPETTATQANGHMCPAGNLTAIAVPQ